ncbi:hypothetical protein ACHAW5_009924 [Stephanodiscus triporus]|uniref:Uncharacterized protein n=1 Tax=Stephanodiscus triporus TaxID=2934178 RepID=A0ABD3N4V3_9STRA
MSPPPTATATTTNSKDNKDNDDNVAVVVAGVDLGCLTTKVILGSNHDHELVRNSQGGHVTPTVVTFVDANHPRLLGEDAHDPGVADGGTIWGLDRLLVDSLSSSEDEDGGGGGGGGGGGASGRIEDVLSPFRRFRFDVDADYGRGAARVPSTTTTTTTNENENENGDGGGPLLPSTSLVAAFLGKVGNHAMATARRMGGGGSGVAVGDGGGGGGGIDRLHLVFAVPDSWPRSTRDELVDAARASGVIRSSVVNSSACVAAAYRRRFGDDGGLKGRRSVAIVVEVGHVRSSVTVLGRATTTTTTAAAAAAADDDDDVEADGGEIDVDVDVDGRVVVLSSVSSSNLGGFLVDVALYDHFLSTHPALGSEIFPRDSRRSQRLLAGCNKLKHVLSMLPEGKVTVENVGRDDADVDLSCTRESMERLCEHIVEKLTTMIRRAISESGRSSTDVDAVEVAGGGSRVPMIREAIRAACGKGEGYVPSRSFDDSYLAFGASLIGVVPPTADDDDDRAMIDDDDRASRRSRLREAEDGMRARDARMLRRAELRNGIEARVLELRSARDGRHGDLLPKTDEFARYLDETDDWLFSDECDVATADEMEARWDKVRSRTEDMCADYYAAEREYSMEKEREMEEGARLAAAERAAEVGGGDGDDEDDHDTRRLPTKRRMEIVMKNKNEANELFSDGNYRHAAARYAKALGHTAKLFDLSPAEEEEAREVKLSLYLNLAFAYIKLDKLDNAMQSCDDALKLDGTNVKALYRRATVLYQKRKFDDAVRDLEEAGRLAPEDKAVKKLRGLVDQQMAKQKKKERAMAKKMFG